jgi:rhodanese-related sulfurtransferase
MVLIFNTFDIENIRPSELNEKMRRGEDLFLLDVRTPAESAVQTIPGSYLIPLQELGQRMYELPKDKEIVVYCRVGHRSGHASAFLLRQGYKIKNLEGGIMLWNLVENTAAAMVP